LLPGGTATDSPGLVQNASMSLAAPSSALIRIRAGPGAS
jgi:hypothetical protein